MSEGTPSILPPVTLGGGGGAGGEGGLRWCEGQVDSGEDFSLLFYLTQGDTLFHLDVHFIKLSGIDFSQ